MSTALHFGWSRSLLLLLASLSITAVPHARAEYAVEVPALAVSSPSPEAPGVFTVKVIWWDQKPDPDPVRLQWKNGFINAFEYGQIRSRWDNRSATVKAFLYAVERTPDVHHTGTVNVQGVGYGSTWLGGSSAGAAMAVGFIALFKQDTIKRGVALTGTLEKGGRIGQVGGIAGKVRAAAREGYHTILIPAGQLNDPRWQLGSLALELNVTVKEVSYIEEAYALMTTGTL